MAGLTREDNDHEHPRPDSWTPTRSDRRRAETSHSSSPIRLRRWSPPWGPILVTVRSVERTTTERKRWEGGRHVTRARDEPFEIRADPYPRAAVPRPVVGV